MSADSSVMEATRVRKRSRLVATCSTRDDVCVHTGVEGAACEMNTCQRCHTHNIEDAVMCRTCGQELKHIPRAHRPTSIPYSAVIHSAPVAPQPAALQTDLRRMTPHLGPLVIALILTSGDRYFLSGKSDYVIGRLGPSGFPPDVDLSDVFAFEAGVSRQHAMIHVRANGVFVEDLGSTNETVHNGYRLMPEQWYPLRDGDELRLGAIILNVSFGHL